MVFWLSSEYTPEAVFGIKPQVFHLCTKKSFWGRYGGLGDITRGGNLFWKGWVRSELFFYKKTFIFIFLRNAKNRASGHNIGPLCYFFVWAYFSRPRAHVLNLQWAFFYAMWFSDFLQNTPPRPFLESNRKYFISALKNHFGVVTVAWGT